VAIDGRCVAEVGGGIVVRAGGRRALRSRLGRVTDAVIEQRSLRDQERDKDRQERKAMPHQDLSATSHATDIL
jgi:hypothetical protein